jgi:predicted dehydrogenase
MRQIGVGLIGCGVWGEVHARTYAASPYVKLIGVCDRDIKRAQGFMEKYGAETSFAEWSDLLARPDIEGVSIATPDFAHSEIVLAAMEAGKKVLVEKPLATTVKECREIIKARDKHNALLMVDFHNRWNIPFVHIRNMVESGEIGDLIMINFRLNDTLYVPTKMLSWADKSSPAHFLGSHLIDLIRWLTGAEIQRVFSVSRSIVLKSIGIDTPDFFQTILELSNGGTAVIENCWILSESSPSIYELKGEFVGTKGCTYANISHNRVVEKFTSQGAQLPDVLGSPDLYGKPVGFCTASIEHFIDCIINDKTPLVTAEDGLKVAQVIQAMLESARSGKAVKL